MQESLPQKLKRLVVDAASNAMGIRIESALVVLEHPAQESFGDYTTNIALILGPKHKVNPKEIAEKIVKELSASSKFKDNFESVSVAGPGFVNFKLKSEHYLEPLKEILVKKDSYGKSRGGLNKKILVEYAHPNTHKEMHIGHMRTLITGEALARILELSGATVFRANYQGDIGPHVAKSIWGTQQLLEQRNISWEEAEKMSLKEKAHLLGEGYVKGSAAYEDNKEEIDKINTQLYKKDNEVWPVYIRTRRWSLDYYDMFYTRFDTKFDRLYFESDVAESGKKIVEENIGKVFEESEGAIIFDGERYGLHKRVFITSDGNPTYEGKEIGLAPLQHLEFPFDKAIHVVANEQAGYFQVVIKALELVDPKYGNREFHLSMGMVNLVGRKISSRTGVIITVDGLLDDVKTLVVPLIHNTSLTQDEKEKVAEAVTLAAVKYSVLRPHPTANAAFDLEKSVSISGDSGPYLQYTYARARSVIVKAGSNVKFTINPSAPLRASNLEFNEEEGSVLRWLGRYTEVLEQAAKEYNPSLVCNYLFELAQRFNTFYNGNSILGDDKSKVDEFRIALTVAVAQILKNGLWALGMSAPEKM